MVLRYDFLLFVEKEWAGLDVKGRGDFVLKEKLRLHKGRLSLWNINVFGKYDLEVEEGAMELNVIDDLDPEDEGRRKKRKRKTVSFGLILR